MSFCEAENELSGFCEAGSFREAKPTEAEERRAKALARRWSELNHEAEQRHFARQSMMEDGGPDYDLDDRSRLCTDCASTHKRDQRGHTIVKDDATKSETRQ